MQFQTCFLLFVSFAGVVDASEVTPIQKVVTLLTGMAAKGAKERSEEQDTFATSSEFCRTTQRDKTVAISDSTDKIESLKASIQKDGTEVARLSREMASLNTDEDGWNGDIKAANNVRAADKADYETMHKDLTESISAVGRAVSVMSKQTKDRAQSFAQVSALQSLALVPLEAKKTLDAFLEQGEDALETGAPKANAYEFQSGGVVDMLENLLSKFSKELNDLQKKEVQAVQANSMVVQDLTQQVKQAVREQKDKSVTKTKKLASKAENTGDLQATTELLNVDSKFLADFTASCDAKAAEYKVNQKIRAEELVAVNKALEIVSGGAVSGNINKHLTRLAQTSSTSLGQLRSSLLSPTQQRASRFLQTQAEQLHSAVLSTVAIRAAADPFAKVTKMVQGLITKLQNEASDEAGEKEWCDDELSFSATSRKDKTDEVMTLTADIESLEAKIAKLGDEQTELASQLVELDKTASAATAVRTTEKSQNKVKVADAQAAQTAVAQALAVLRDFYASAASFEQISAPYKGQQGDNNSVLNMLEVIQSDFARLESETQTSEAAAATEYESLMSDTNVDKATKTTASVHTEARLAMKTSDLSQRTTSLKESQTQLDASNAYFEKLKPKCIDSGDSYKDRVAKREAEVASMQNALKILSGEDI